MKEVGLDVSRKTPRLLTEELVNKADKVIAMDFDLLKNISKNLSKTENWQIKEPLGKFLERVRKIRDEIKVKVEWLIKKFYVL